MSNMLDVCFCRCRQKFSVLLPHRPEMFVNNKKSRSCWRQKSLVCAGHYSIMILCVLHITCGCGRLYRRYDMCLLHLNTAAHVYL